MYSFLKYGHLVLGVTSAVLFMILVVYYLILFFSNKNLVSLVKLSFYNTILLHIQFIIGVVYYFYSPITRVFMEAPKIGIKLKDIRFYSLEHPLMMIFFLLFMTLFNISVKRNKKSVSFVYLIISFLLIYFAFPLDRVL